MIRAGLHILLASLFLATAALASPPELQTPLPGAEMRGETRASWLALPIYDAQLWTSSGQNFSFDAPFALTLRYAYGFSAETLARASVKEMARIDGSSRARFRGLEPQLIACFANVDRGDRITGVSDTPDRAHFFVNGRKSCELRFPELRKLFFGIWLGPESRDPKGAARLKGISG